MAVYERGFCQTCSKIREDTDNDRGLCRSCVWYHYPDSDEGRRCKVELDAEAAARIDVHPPIGPRLAPPPVTPPP